MRTPLVRWPLPALIAAALLLPGWRADDPPDLAATIRADIAGALDQLQETGDFDAAQKRLNVIFDQAIAYAPDDEKTLFRDAALARRLVQMLAKAEPASRRPLLEYLRANPALARALGFLVKSDEEPEEVLAVLETLRQRHGPRLEAYATLAAAICVVHDKPLRRSVNENSAKAPDPVLVFEYFARYEKRMLFGIRDVPAELLVYVVDVTASIDEMLWALDRYAGDTNVGARFFDIDYDYDHFRKGRPKKVTVAGWNLPNILRHGGVCADQAYYAMTVGKSIGVPTAYTRGASSSLSHAWVGFVQSNGRKAWWNFDTGRYEAYRGVRGSVHDPQVRRSIPDSYVSLLAAYVTASAVDREYAAATNEAVQRLAHLDRRGRRQAPPRPEGFADEPVRRRPVVADQLDLLEAGLRACPANIESWFTLKKLSEAGRLNLAAKKKWASVLHRLCGRAYPDFYLAVLEPMIATVDDVREQNRLWNAAFESFQHRHDLAAAVRMHQAKMWLDHGEAAKAGRCYEDVIDRYANAGPFVISAVKGAEKILRDAGAGRRVLMLYERAFSSIRKPKDMAAPFARQSNWYRIGKLYESRLREAGLDADAEAVLAKLSR